MNRTITRGLFVALAITAVAQSSSIVADEFGHPLAQRTAEHDELYHEIGVWDAETKMWMTPDSEPAVGKATETNRILGEVWLISDFEGNFAGMPFEGHGQFGYDPVTKKYIGTWIDSMSPFLSVMEGTKGDDGKLTMISKGRDLMTAEESVTKIVTTITDQNHKTFEMYAQVPGKKGQWWKMMEIKYTRRK